jgi:chromosome segregation ATPase
MNTQTYWTKIQHLVHEEASADISTRVDAVRVFKCKDVEPMLKYAQEKQQEDAREIAVLGNRLSKTFEQVNQLVTQIDSAHLQCHSLMRENANLRLDVKDANARIEELTKGIIKLALALVE